MHRVMVMNESSKILGLFSFGVAVFVQRAYLYRMPPTKYINRPIFSNILQKEINAIENYTNFN